MPLFLPGFVLGTVMTSGWADRDRAAQVSLLGGMMGGSLAGVVLLASVANEGGVGAQPAPAPAPGTAVQPLPTPTQVQIPVVAELSSEQATKVISSRDLQAAVINVESGEQDKDTVIDSDPPAGTILDRRSTVRIHVSAGLEVPNVIGQAADVAVETLRTAGFEVVELGEIETPATADTVAGTVELQHPPAHTFTSASQPVSIQVYQPRTPAAWSQRRPSSDA
jgi:PASTA domain